MEAVREAVEAERWQVVFFSPGSHDGEYLMEHGFVAQYQHGREQTRLTVFAFLRRSRLAGGESRLGHPPTFRGSFRLERFFLCSLGRSKVFLGL